MSIKYILLCCVFLSVKRTSNGQQAMTNFGNLQLHNGATLTGFNDLTNTSSAILLNNGTLTVKGSITNDEATMNVGGGTLILSSTSAQSINGAQPFRTNHFVNDNAVGITLNNNLSISGVHTFTNGFINSSATPNYLIYEAGASHTGSADSRHVTGWVKKYGNTDFTFPVGDAVYLRDVTLTNLSASSEFNCHYYTPTQNLYNLTSPVVRVKANEYWQLDKVSGGTAQVTLNWDHSKVAMDNVLLTDILVARYNGSNWTDAGGSPLATGLVTSTGSVISSATSSFDAFTIGYKTFPVPLQLISFTAERRTGVSYLQWITDNEQHVSHFEVQRSYDGINFTNIGTVPARNSGVEEHYRFEDNSPLRGFAWYRISSIDIDGKFSFTRVAVVSESALSGSSFVVMNPVKTSLTIFNKTGTDGVFDYNLFTSSGQLVMKGTVSMSNNGGIVLPLLSTITSGLYILELKKESILFRQKVIVAK